MSNAPVLIILGGLPGVGKTTIAKELVRRIGVVHVRIDSIEQLLRDSGELTGAMDEAGYRLAYELAEKHLRSGRDVVADCVNPIRLTRNAWRKVAQRCGAVSVEVEITCSDQAQHRRRVEGRDSDIPGLILPTWQEVLDREYEPRDGARIRVDTANCTMNDGATRIIEAMVRTGARREDRSFHGRIEDEV